MRTKKKTTFSFISMIFLFVIGSVWISSVSGFFDSKDSFSWENGDLIDSVILFKSEWIESGIPEQYIICEYDCLNGINALIPQDMFDYLETADFVESITENSEIQVEFLEDVVDWGTDMINAERVWGGQEDAVDIAPGRLSGQGVRVAILGSGVQTTHSDLNDNYRGGYDFIENDNVPDDDHGHGTRCAGVIAAEDNGFGAIGVAPNVEFYAIKVFDAEYKSTTSIMTAGINWAVSHGIDVLSMSFGSFSYPSYAGALNAAFNNGIILVASAGNEDTNTISYPARLSSVIGVGAINQAQQRATYPTWGSNYGQDLEIMAPGVSIYTTNINNQWSYSSGTSYSAPMVAGVIALMLESNPALTPTQVRTILRNTAIDLGSTGFDIFTGYGMVDALAASNQALPTDPPAKVTGLKTTEVADIFISLSWNANTQIDFDHYNIYRNGLKIGETSNNYYTDNGLVSGTSYVYRVAAVDAYGNIGPNSDSLTVTTLDSTYLHVDSITMISLGDNIIFGQIPGFKWAILMYIYVKDSSGKAIEGVTVSYTLKLNTGRIISYVSKTDSKGYVSIIYLNWRLWPFKAGKYTCTVTSLEKSDYEYDPSSNVVTSKVLFL